MRRSPRSVPLLDSRRRRARRDGGHGARVVLPRVLRQAVVTVADLLMLTVMVFVTVTIVAGFAVLMLHGFGHEPECACGCPAGPSSEAVMCGQCEQEVLAAAGMCRLCWSLPGTHDGLCRRCDATVRAEVERETTL